ncbi:MAG: 2-keto-4-pentenoate hydratase [Pseudomonadota bacterium]
MPLENDPAEPRPLSPALEEVSQRLVSARLGARALDSFPGQLPASLEDAYSVQSASMARWPDRVAGWKVGGVPTDLREVLGAARLSGPIYRASLAHTAVGEQHTMAIFEGGFAAVEAEFIFCLDEAFPPDGRVYGDDDLIERITLHVGAEIASSPMADINRIGPVCVVCDFGNNGGLLVGPAIPQWHTLAEEELSARVHVDGVLAGAATVTDVEGGLLAPLRFLLALCTARGLTLEAGTFVSCGALTGIHEVTVDSHAKVQFGGVGAFDVTFEARQPMPDSAASAEH